MPDMQGATQTVFLELLGKLRDQKKTKLTILLLGERLETAAIPCMPAPTSPSLVAEE